MTPMMRLLVAEYWWVGLVAAAIGVFFGATTHGRPRAGARLPGVLVLGGLFAFLAVVVVFDLLSGRAAIVATLALFLLAAYLAGCIVGCLFAGRRGEAASSSVSSEAEAARLATYDSQRVSTLGATAAADTAAAVTAHSVPSRATMTAAAAAEATARTVGSLVPPPNAGNPSEGGAMEGRQVPVSVGIAAPRGGKPDDLTRIHGIDAEMARKLNLLGLFHYSQLADLPAEERRWVFAQLGYRDRLPAGWWRWRYDALVLSGRLTAPPMPPAAEPDEATLRALAAGAASRAVAELQQEGAVPGRATLAAAAATTGETMGRAGLLGAGPPEPAPAEPYSWQAIVAPDAVTLFGNVPNAAVGARLMAVAAASSPRRPIVDRQQVKAGAPAGFETAAATALHAAGLLDEGRASLVDAQMRVDGRCAAINRAAIDGLTVPAGFARGTWHVTADAAPEPGAAVVVEPSAHTTTAPPIAGAQPPVLAAPDGPADDLKRIRGIGRQNEARLNALGIWHYRQIAAWTPAEAVWIGATLAFPGRIERETWIEQAKILAAGGATAFAGRVDRGEVPTSAGGAT